MSIISKIRSILLPPILIVVGIVLAYGAHMDGAKMKAIADHGRAADATVDSVHWKEKGLSKREKNFKVDIHFKTEDQKEITTKISVSKSLGQTLRDATTPPVIKIKYLPESPTTAVLADETDDTTALMLAGIAVMLVGIGMLVFRFMRRGQGEPAAA